MVWALFVLTGYVASQTKQTHIMHGLNRLCISDKCFLSLEGFLTSF